MTSTMVLDAEVELRLLHEVVLGHPYLAGSKLPKNGSHLLAVYDGPWVYYEIQAEESTKQGPVQ